MIISIIKFLVRWLIIKWYIGWPILIIFCATLNIFSGQGWETTFFMYLIGFAILAVKLLFIIIIPLKNKDKKIPNNNITN